MSKHEDFSGSLLSSFHLPPPLLPPNSPFLGWPLCCVQTLLKTFLPLRGGVGTGVIWVYLTQKYRLSSQTESEFFPWGHMFSFPARNPFNMHSFQWGCKTHFRSKQKIVSSVGFLGQPCVYIDPCSFMPLLCRSELLSHFPEEGTLELWLPPVAIRHPTNSGGFQRILISSLHPSHLVAKDPHLKIRGTHRRQTPGGCIDLIQVENISFWSVVTCWHQPHVKGLFSSSPRKWTVSYLCKLCKVTEEQSFVESESVFYFSKEGRCKNNNSEET